MKLRALKLHELSNYQGSLNHLIAFPGGMETLDSPIAHPKLSFLKFVHEYFSAVSPLITRPPAPGNEAFSIRDARYNRSEAAQNPGMNPFTPCIVRLLRHVVRTVRNAEAKFRVLGVYCIGIVRGHSY